jgi:hypothetical protein
MDRLGPSFLLYRNVGYCVWDRILSESVMVGFRSLYKDSKLMCEITDRLKLLPHSVAVLYRKTTDNKFKPHQQYVFELAIHAMSDPVPGEIQLVTRFRKRFDNVSIRKDAGARTVIRIVSEPLMKACAKQYIVRVIADTASQHYGWMVPVTIIEAEASVCMDRSPALFAA